MSGCLLPGRVCETPHIAGRVVDAATKWPISGAMLQFERYQEHPVVTSAAGRFDIPEICPTELYPVPLPDVGGGNRYLLVRASGYRPERLFYWRWKTSLHETILLKRR